jgi:drug/metabolite transporter (DMT)-like permease
MAETDAQKGSAVRPAEFAMLGGLGLVWGSSFLFIALTVATIPPMTMTVGRLLVGAAIMTVVAALAGERLPTSGRVWAGYMVIGIFGNALPYFLVSSGQTRIESSLTAILMATGPIFTTILAHFFTRDDRASRRKGAGVALGFAGVAMLIGPDALAGLGASLIGQLLVIGGVFSFAVNNLLARLVHGQPPAVSAAAALYCGALWAIPACLIFERPFDVAPSALSILSLLALALFSSAFANMLFFRLSRTAKPSFVSLTSYIMPSVGVLWGVTLLGETLTWRQIASLAVILAGIAAASGRLRLPAALRRAG